MTHQGWGRHMVLFNISSQELLLLYYICGLIKKILFEQLKKNRHA